jgi:predicted AAA+ superfamily ATPase
MEYLAELETHRGKSGLIKVVTGVRRCGKSTLLELYQKKLEKDRIPQSQIINISLESIENEELRDGKILYKHIKNQLTNDGLYYVFIDEIQLAHGYEEAANSLRLLKNVDLYVTGSNSNILTGELATRWAGRYVEIKMLPLSFKEYVSVSGNVQNNPDLIFKKYIEHSSFPEALAYNVTEVRSYLETIYNSIMIKDVMLQHGVKEAALLERVVKCLFSNIGSETTVNGMVNMLNNDMKLMPSEKKVYAATLEAYIDALLKSFVFYKAERHYIKGREYLRTNAKYYAVDTGLRYFLLGNKGADSGHILENIVFLEL